MGCPCIPGSHKRAVRERIVRTAAEELRRNGLAGIGIPALMKRAGLTHGAFYAHFPSRDALVAEAIRTAAAASAEGPLADDLPLEECLQHYLSGGHLAHPAGGPPPRRPAPEPGEDALRRASTMVGAVVLARLVDDPALAQRLLAAVT